MDEIIYLEPDEEITSVIDKIKNASAASLGLVVPRDATLLQSVVNLRLLNKEASFLQKKISIVTSDKIGRNLAAQVGLPVYSSIREERPTYIPPAPVVEPDEVLEVQNTEPQAASARGVNVHHFQDERPAVQWKPNHKPQFSPQPEKELKPKPKFVDRTSPVKKEHDPKAFKIIWPILAIIFGLALVGLYLIWPTSNVEIFLKSEELKKSMPLVFTNTVTKPDLTQNVFPGNLIEASKEKTQKFSTTGKKDLGGKASGTVSFTNGLDSLAHKLPAGAKLLSSNKTFLLKSAITVPGATVQNLKVVPGTISADIEAENAGDEYNIKATKFTISGLPANQQEALYAQSSSDLKGGFTKEVQVVSKDDYENAKKQLVDDLSGNIDQDLKAKAQGLKIIEKSGTIPDPEVTSSSSIDQEASDFEMKVKITKQVMAYDFGQFQNYLVSSLETKIDPGKMVIIPSEEDFGFTIDKIAFDKGELDLTANISAKIVDKIDINQIKTKIVGKSQDSAESLIMSQPGVSKAVFTFNPAWWKKMSVLGKNVNVKVNFLTE
jgi:hypothetical protein